MGYVETAVLIDNVQPRFWRLLPETLLAHNHQLVALILAPQNPNVVARCRDFDQVQIAYVITADVAFLLRIAPFLFAKIALRIYYSPRDLHNTTLF
jgi:hypothetical protein